MFESQLNPMQRTEHVKALGRDEFDVLVIGGGITGVGTALDAASRGLKVALVESQDLASGTSSRSSKLIHGGLRYLEQYNFKLVREALHERELLVSQLAPHLVKPVGFLYPLHEKVKERTYIGAGLALYDALRGFQRALPTHKHISQKKIAEIAPSLRTDLITGAIKYFDAGVDDARHTFSVARTAVRHGAIVVTRMQCQELIRDGKKVIGAKVRDLISGDEISVSSKVTVMCAGIWSDELHKKFGIKPSYKVAMSKGAHIVLPGKAIKSDAGIILRTEISVLFVIPWREQWIVGTTDTPYKADRNNPTATKEDIEYILSEANRILEPKISASEIIGVYAGLRPLVANVKSSTTTDLSREHVIDSAVPGFISIAGGKYTTYRIMAKDVIDVAVKELKGNIPKSITHKLPAIGADGYFALMQQIKQISGNSGLSEAVVTSLLNRYGSLINEVIELVDADNELGEHLTGDLPYIKAEIVYAASHEGALSIEDVISRRTRIAFESIDGGAEIINVVADLIAPILSWTDEMKSKSISDYLNSLARDRKSLEELLSTFS